MTAMTVRAHALGGQAARRPRTPRQGRGIAALVYLVASYQTWSLSGGGGSGPEIKILHVWIACTALMILPRMTVVPRVAPLLLHALGVTTISLLAYMWNPFDALVFNYVFCAAVLVVLGTQFQRFEYGNVLSGLRIGSTIIACLIAGNTFMNWDRVQAAQNANVADGTRPEIEPLIYAGGLNVEQSWVALGAAFFLRSPRAFWYYSALSLAIQLAYMTRTGFLIAILICLVRLARTASRRLGWTPIVLGGVVIMASGYQIALLLAPYVPVLDRFLHIGNEPGSMDRMQIYGAAWHAFLQHPFFGVGAGNEVDAIRPYGYVGVADNVHSYPIANVLSAGIVGLALLLWALVATLQRLTSRLEAFFFVAVFSVATLVEFRGADTMFYVVVAMLAAARSTDDKPKVTQ